MMKKQKDLSGVRSKGKNVQLDAPFVGREEELKELKLLLNKKSSSLVVINGRRRIGKSRLVREFAKKQNLYILSGIPPTEKTTAQSQREEFARQLNEHFSLPGLKATDWGDLFTLFAKQVSRGKVVLLLDEITWMGFLDPDFLGKLKTAWDLYFSQNSNLILILCGSVSSWIEKNILNSKGFMGRVSLTLHVKELTISECNKFLNLLGFRSGPYECFKMLSVTGGIPRYIEEMQPILGAEENVKRLCFKKSGILFNEFNEIFHDLFSKRSVLYQKIVELLVNGNLEFNEICEKLKVEKSGVMSEYLVELIKAGFIRRDFTWNIKDNQVSNLSYYRLSDNYVRFYLKYIEKNRERIESGHFANRSLSSLPGWTSIIGLQFENLVLNNREFIWKKLNINPEDIVSDNPFFQRKTAKVAGCQVDYLIQTRLNTLYACEIKFSKQEIKYDIISEVQEKLKKLSLPRGFSYFPVLIHVNGVSESVIDAGYFLECIDFSESLHLQ
jgi:AAA+ ATPase superfamily predicted ATPase